MECKIYDAKILLEEHDLYWKYGLHQKEMKIAVENGFIQVLSLQFPGKEDDHEFLNGISFSPRQRSTKLNKTGFTNHNK
jgi:methionyl-tRNA formyltransferase